jgi:hypothetical protein
MGKKDLLKSTSKEKAKKAKKKDAGIKKAALKKAAPKKAAAKKTAPQKAASKAKLSGKELLLEKFDSWKPAKLVKVEPDKEYLNNFKSPPFYDDKSKEDISKINKLLALQFDIKAILASGEKAAAEKAAAEKKAAEQKAAAEKAAAEKKAAEQKAAAEKAAAEKKAAEQKVAAEEKPAPAPKIPEPAYMPPNTEETDVSRKILFIIAACLIVIFIPIIIASHVNTGRYYLEVADGAIELWQGNFSPRGKNLVITMPGAVPPEAIKDVYSKKEVFPIVSGYLIDKADTLLKVEGLPDFQYIKSTLNTAKTYAVTKPLLQSINNRLDRINFMVFLYKADIAAGMGTVEGRKEAIGLLEKAAELGLSPHESELVSKKIKSLKEIKAEAPKKTK